MIGKKMLTVCIVSMLTTACSMEEISAANKKVSDGASDIMNTLRGSRGSTDNGMPYLSPSRPLKKESSSEKYDLPVDVDTAAARLKRHYQFVSNDEVDSVRKKSTNGAWVASAITGNGQEWEVIPGSYYKMGSDWGDQDDHLTIELEKNGTGSKLCITYKSSSQKRLASDSLQQLMKNIKYVAEGTKR
ncbi:TPA: hypothetical protein I8Y21_003932 [Klebsiella oxytoca]|uniref:Lipoprotein n=1 Tax=Klebsiella oxytoca TaxID=571 RepID=A0AAN5RF18_KLEOX|nr:hypothetical protein [Klebsiella oxytoca]